MYFGTKSYLKSNHYHTPKHPLNIASDLRLVENFEEGCCWRDDPLPMFRMWNSKYLTWESQKRSHPVSSIYSIFVNDIMNIFYL
jgi:hypothetical protein